jgi:hypothetical protein
MELADLAAFVPHQANLRITDSLVKSLKLPPSVVVARDVVDSGNTSAASVPLALCRLVEEGQVRRGDPVLPARLRRRAHRGRPGRPLPVGPPAGRLVRPRCPRPTLRSTHDRPRIA